MEMLFVMGPIVFWVVIIALIVSAIRRRMGTGPVLVLKRFRVNPSAPDGMYIDIEGRRPGIIAWLMNLIGLDATTSLQVTATEIYFRSASLFGERHDVVPLTHVSSAHCVYSRPLGFLVFGVLVILATLMGGAAIASDMDAMAGGVVILIGLVVGGLFIAAFFLRKQMRLWVETTGGRLPLGLTFQRSVIENVSVDLNRSLQAITLLHQKVVTSQSHVVSP